MVLCSLRTDSLKGYFRGTSWLQVLLLGDSYRGWRAKLPSGTRAPPGWAPGSVCGPEPAWVQRRWELGPWTSHAEGSRFRDTSCWRQVSGSARSWRGEQPPLEMTSVANRLQRGLKDRRVQRPGSTGPVHEIIWSGLEPELWTPTW